MEEELASARSESRTSKGSKAKAGSTKKVTTEAETPDPFLDATVVTVCGVQYVEVQNIPRFVLPSVSGQTKRYASACWSPLLRVEQSQPMTALL